MITHSTCGSCNNPFTCEEVVKLFRGKLFRSAGANYCPCCYAFLAVGHVGVDFLLDGFDCAPCAGAVGTSRMEDLLDEYPDTMRGTLIVGMLDGVYTGYSPDGGFMQHLYQEALLGALAGGLRTPPRRATASIVLTADQKQCKCNNCETLRVTYA